MGMWGWWLFASEMQQDVHSDMVNLICRLAKGSDDKHSDDKGANTAEVEDDDDVSDQDRMKDPEVRWALGDFLCDYLFKIYRVREAEPERRLWGPKSATIHLGLAVMQSGAKISDDNLVHLHNIASAFHEGSYTEYVPGSFAYGADTPAEAQIIAAVDHYKAGTPRDFHAKFCFYCGKIEADTGKKLLACSKCNFNFFCDAECQKADKYEPSECTS